MIHYLISMVWYFFIRNHFFFFLFNLLIGTIINNIHSFQAIGEIYLKILTLWKARSHLSDVKSCKITFLLATWYMFRGGTIEWCSFFLKVWNCCFWTCVIIFKLYAYSFILVYCYIQIYHGKFNNHNRITTDKYWTVFFFILTVYFVIALYCNI